MIEVPVQLINIENLLYILGAEQVNDFGSTLRCRCYFHNGENHTSLAVNKTNGLFKCYSCGEVGNLVQLVQRTINCSYKEAIIYLEDFSGVKFDSQDIPIREIILMKQLNNLIIEQEELDEQKVKLDYNHTALDYFVKRGFDKEVLCIFNVGFCSDYSEKQLRGRICIPIEDLDGRVVGYSGRVPKDEDYSKKYQIKWGTKKGKVLYNLNRAKNYINQYGYLIVVEGFTSCWALWQSGYKNCVGLMGANMSKDQEELILRHTDKIILGLDNDIAGRTGTEDAIKRLSSFIKISTIEYDDERDLGDLSIEAVEELIGKAAKNFNKSRSNTKIS